METLKSCPGCGKAGVKARLLKDYVYVESGLSNFVLENGVYEYTCKNCDESYICIVEERQLLQFMAILLLLSPYRLNGKEQKFLRKACELTQDELAKALDVRRETIAERESANKSLDKASDFLYRVVVLVKFVEFLTNNNKERSYLAPQHFLMLGEVGKSLLAHVADMRKQARKRIEIKKTAKQTWEVAPASMKAELSLAAS